MNHSPDDDSRISAAIDEFYRDRQARVSFDRDVFLKKHADIAVHLQAFLEGVACVDQHFPDADRLLLTAPYVSDAACERATFPELPEYAIECELGHGGMGIVYRARHRSTPRVVALKMIRSGRLASPEELQRFQVEVQAAAALEQHPNIVPIYDVQITARQPYYTMQLLEGGPLSWRLGRYRDSPKLAAEIIFQIAGAVDHAHRSGVLHRDVKPDNILFDGADRPHLVDFGLAKRCGGDQDLTHSIAVVGAANYMPPEQAAGRSKLATTAADIYSLGATLYALLVGKPPFASDSAMKTLQLVQTAEAVPPRKLNRKVPHDLDVICLKCLAKEPGDRYNTAGELADDLRCFLCNLPIRARPVSAPARFWRWCQRNRAVAVLLVLVLTASTAGSIASTIFWRRAERQRDRAESSYRLSRQALDRSVRLIIDDPQFKSGPLERFRAHILNAHLEYHKQFVEQFGSDSAFLADLGRSHLEMGNAVRDLHDSRTALPHLHEAVRIFASLSESEPAVNEHRARLAESYSSLAIAFSNLGQTVDAERETVAAVRLREMLAAANPANCDYQRAFADALNALGEVQNGRDRSTEAEATFLQSLSIYRMAASDDPSSDDARFGIAAVLNSLGSIYQSHNRLRKAEEAFTEAREIYLGVDLDSPENTWLREPFSWLRSELAALYASRGDYDAALEEHRAVITLREKLAREHPVITGYSAQLAVAWDGLGDLCRSLGRFREAQEAHLKSMSVLTGIDPEAQKTEIVQSQLGDSIYGLGMDYSAAGQLERAEEFLRKAASAFHELGQNHLERPQHADREANALADLASLLRRLNRDDEAEKAVRNVIDLRASMLRLQPNAADHQESLADAYDSLADLLLKTDRRDGAEEAAQKAFAVRMESTPANPRSPEILARAHEAVARLHKKLRRFKKAETAYREALAIRKSLAADDPEDDEKQHGLAQLHNDLGNLLSECGWFQSASESFLEATRIRRRLARKSRATPETPLEIADDQLDLGAIARWSGEYAKALEHLGRAISTLPSEAGTSDSPGRNLLISAHANCGIIFNILDRHAEGLAAWERAIELSGGTIHWIRINRAQTLVRLMRIGEAAAAAEDVLASDGLTPNDLRTAAGVFALCSAGNQPETEAAGQFALRAVELLRRAVAAGYGNVREVENADDLKLLRARADFQEILVQLQATR
jgi:serine/threonine protein kinase